jgi:hypothetical protein
LEAATVQAAIADFYRPRPADQGVAALEKVRVLHSHIILLEPGPAVKDLLEATV